MGVVQVQFGRPAAAAPVKPGKPGGLALIVQGFTVLTNNERTFMQLVQHMGIAKDVCKESEDRP